MLGAPGELVLRRSQTALVGSKTPMVDAVLVPGGGGGGGGGVTPPPPEAVALMPDVPRTVPTVSGMASLKVSGPAIDAASVPTLLAWSSVNVPVPIRRRLAAWMIEPPASVTPGALMSTVAPAAVIASLPPLPMVRTPA